MSAQRKDTSRGSTFKLHETLVGFAMLLFTLFAVLSAEHHNFPIAISILFVLLVGSVPWILYNFLAYVVGWEKSHPLNLFWYWFDIILYNFPWW